MSYATKGNVKSLFRDFADNLEAAVTDDELDLFLENTAAEIDAKIGTLYQMPITEIDSPQSFKILKQIHMYKVACIVDDIINSYGEADKKPMWCKKAMMMIDALVPPKKKNCKQCEPTMKLPDAEYEGTSIQKNQIRLSQTSGRIFEKNKNNW